MAERDQDRRLEQFIAELNEWAENNPRPPEGELLPPWSVRPDLRRGSIGWRMGPGEDVMISFLNRYRALSGAERVRFRKAHPEPDPWKGWYDVVEANS